MYQLQAEGNETKKIFFGESSTAFLFWWFKNAQMLYVTHEWPWFKRHFCSSIYNQVLGVLVFQSFESQVKPITATQHICAYELFGNEIDSVPTLSSFQISRDLSCRDFFFVTLLTVVLFCAVSYVHIFNPPSNLLRMIQLNQGFVWVETDKNWAGRIDDRFIQRTKRKGKTNLWSSSVQLNGSCLQTRIGPCILQQASKHVNSFVSEIWEETNY